MKKLITLLIVLICCVCTVGATKRRFYAQNQVGWTAVKMYCEADNKALTEAWPGTAMTKIGDSQWWYLDVDVADNSSVKIVFNNGNSGGSNQTYDYDNLDISESDYRCYIYDVNNEELHRISPVAMDYYFVNWDSKVTQKLTFDGGKYKCTLDYTTLTDNGYRVIVPDFGEQITMNDTHTEIKWWAAAIRPKTSGSDFAINAFTAYSDEYGTSNVWKFDTSISLPYDCVFDIANNTWSITPYIEKTIGGTTQYATLGTPTDWKMEIPTGVTAYYVSGVADNVATMSSEISAGKTLPGGEGFIIKGTLNDTYKFYASNETGENLVSTTSNKLVSTGTTGATPGKEGVYILALNDNNEAAFFPYSGTGTIGAFKSYLQTSSGAKSILLNFDETTNININVTEKLNSTAPMYNLAGQKVGENYKGIVIQNGKKYVNN